MEQDSITPQLETSTPSFFERLIDALQTFSPKLLFVFGILLLGSIGVLLYGGSQFLEERLVTIPTYGGTIKEGVIGTPHVINPVLAVSNTDRDLSALIYSGLLRKENSNSFIPDLAETYTVSKDGLSYEVILKENIRFHDGSKVTPDDVIYTIAMTQDPVIKSPRKIEWEGVAVEKTGDRTLHFSLKKPYPNFLENLTIGILPKNIWSTLSSEEFSLTDFNTEPIGSGPYKIKSVKKVSGRPVLYELESFRDFALGRPYINSIFIQSYPNENTLLEAFKNKEVTNISALTPERASELHDDSRVIIRRYPLPRVFALFLNQNKASSLISKNLRQAIQLSMDRMSLIQAGLFGFASSITNPLPAGHPKSVSATSSPDIALAQELIEKDGWKKNTETGFYEKGTKEKTELHLSITTSDIEELKTIGGVIVDTLNDIGIRTELSIFEDGSLRQNVIKPRKYEALLYGNVVDQESDLYAYWHSQGRVDPGLNIAQYTNAKVDAAVEVLKETHEEEVREKNYEIFLKEIGNDIPAIFLYTPDFIYVTDVTLQGIATATLKTGSDRLQDAYRWYMKVERVWPLFKDIPSIKKLSELVL